MVIFPEIVSTPDVQDVFALGLLGVALLAGKEICSWGAPWIKARYRIFIYIYIYMYTSYLDIYIYSILPIEIHGIFSYIYITIYNI